MAQNGLNVTMAVNPAGQSGQLYRDASGLLLNSRGGKGSLLNVTAAVVVKAAVGRVAKVIVITPGITGGAFTLNDCATTGAATLANTIWTLPYNAASNVAGAVFDLDFPVAFGLVVSAVPTAGAPVLAISFS